MRKLATVAVINAIKPIEGADNICSYKIRNWWVVDKVNKYKVGDMVVYYEIDSILPIKIEMADGASKLNHVTNREGLVIRGHNNEYSVKCISNKFLLKSEK